MASTRIRTRKDGTSYTSVLYRADGQQRSTSFDDHAAALRYLKLLEQVGPDEAEKIIGIERQAAHEVTATEWITEYISHLTGIEEGSRRRYRAYLANDIENSIGALPLSAVTEATIARWVQGMEGSGKTITNKHGFLSAALQAAVRAGKIPANPCEGRRLPRKDDGDDEQVFLTPDEFAILRGAMTARWQPLVTFLVSTGMRYSEACALTVGDIDPDAGTIRIVKAWKYTGTSERRLGAPKSKKSVRTINVPPHAIAAAGDLTRPPGELVFTTQSGGPISAQLFHNKAWKPAIAKVEQQLGKRPRPHDLRHTCASWLIAAGVPLPVIQAHLGHESINTTISVYGHLDRTSAQAAAGALNAALAGI